MASLSRIFSHRGVRVAAGVFLVLVIVAIASAPTVLAAEVSSPGPLATISNWIGGIFMNLAAGIGALISNFIEIIVAVLQYNNFSNSPVVNAGWAIIRDTVNMFYVVLLIIIAFGTIIGSSKFTWAQDISKLLRWAIIINFSKTLCGLMIDASQVVTLTFANAIKDIAGGNFVTFLGLNDILSLSTQTPDLTSGNPGGYQSFDFLVGGIMAFVMMLIVLVVLVALLAILAFRIVMLWILITISPLTWFANSIPKGITIGQSAYQEWWGNFKCYLLVGPVLVFFLWLALAVAGAGNIAAIEGFNVADTNNSGLINKIFDMPRLTSFILGLALIMAGFQQAASICKSAQGMGSLSVGSLLKKAEATVFGGKGGFAGEGGLVRSPWTAAKAGGARIPLVGNKAAGGSALTRRAQNLVGKMPVVGGFAAGALSGRVAEQEKLEKEEKLADAKKIGDLGKSIGDDKAQLEFMKSMGASSNGQVGMFGSAKRDQSLAMAKKLVEDKSFREKMEREGVPVEKILGMNADATKDAFGKDDAFKKQFDEFKKQRPDIYAKTEDIKDADGKVTGKKYKFGDSIKTVEDLKKVDWDSMERMKETNPDAFAQFEKFLKEDFKGDKDVNTGKVLTGHEMLEKGLLGKGAADKYKRPPQDLMAAVDANYSNATGTLADASIAKRITEAVKSDPATYVPQILSRIQASGGRDTELSRAAIAALTGGGKGNPGKTGELLAKVDKKGPDAAGARTALLGAAQILHAAPPTKENEKKLTELAGQWKNAGLGDIAGEANIMPIQDIEMASQLGRTKKAFRDDQPEMKRLVELGDTEFENELSGVEYNIYVEAAQAKAAQAAGDAAGVAASQANVDRLRRQQEEIAKAQTVRYAQMDATVFESTRSSTETEITAADTQMRAATDDAGRQAAQQQKAILEERKAILNRVQGIRQRAEKVAEISKNEGGGKKKKGRS